MKEFSKTLVKQFAAPWPPGCDSRTITKDGRILYFLLRRGATTPPDIYLKHWNQQTRCENALCPN